MSSNKTQNLNLHSWVSSDPFKRSEFNENFAAIDAACGTIPKIATGSYGGNGVGNTAKTITFPFAPKLVLLSDGSTANQNWFVWIPGVSTVQMHGATSELTCTSSGNTLSLYSGSAPGQYNASGKTYRWLAIG